MTRRSPTRRRRPRQPTTGQTRHGRKSQPPAPLPVSDVRATTVPYAGLTLTSVPRSASTIHNEPSPIASALGNPLTATTVPGEPGSIRCSVWDVSPPTHSSLPSVASRAGAPGDRNARQDRARPRVDHPHAVDGREHRAAARAPTETEDRRDGGPGQNEPAEREQESSAAARGRARQPPRRPAKLGVLVEDRPLEFLKLRSRLDAELVGQLAAGLLVALQRVGLSARPVQARASTAPGGAP